MTTEAIAGDHARTDSEGPHSKNDSACHWCNQPADGVDGETGEPTCRDCAGGDDDE